MSVRLGVDVGGTFTDLVLFDAATNRIHFTKTSSTPANQAVGVEEGIRKVAGIAAVPPGEIEFFVHGTTVATNALLERKGVSCALLVTEGFRDVLQIGRQDRPKLYDWFAQRPTPLVPRAQTFEIRERMLHTGDVLTPLDEAQAREAIRAARAAGVTAIAVCLLHAYANPAHERRVGELIAEEFPDAEVSLSSDVIPEFREYERASTTAVNAYVMPIVRRYVARLADRTAAMGVPAELHIMQSNGGLMTARAAAEQSVRTMLSGPAAGVLGAVALARQAGFENVLSVDMGGTSFDICLAYDGSLRFTKESEIGSLPIKVPMIDIHTLGAGGGSVAWIDAGGALRVGPRSAGAQPGPACYGRGGDEATVTDANVVLGRIDPANFLGGEMALDAAAAWRAVEDRIARPLGLGVEEAAEGIVRVINATMVRGMRAVSVEKGYDPRDFAIVAFGGGGPLHAADLARELGVPSVLVPVMPGVTSALGLLVADLRYDVSATVRGSLASPDHAALTARVRGPGAGRPRADGAGRRGAWRGAAQPDRRRAVRAAVVGAGGVRATRVPGRNVAGAGSLRIPCAPHPAVRLRDGVGGADPRQRAGERDRRPAEAAAGPRRGRGHHRRGSRGRCVRGGRERARRGDGPRPGGRAADMARRPLGPRQRLRPAGPAARFGDRRAGNRRTVRHDDVPRPRRPGTRGRLRQPRGGGGAMTTERRRAAGRGPRDARGPAQWPLQRV